MNIATDALVTAKPRDRERVRTELALLHRQAISAELLEDPSGEHIFRIGKLASLFAAQLGQDDDACFMLDMNARLHDIGKIGIPPTLLGMRGEIPDAQRPLLRSHADVGAELLAQAGLTYLADAVDIARHHHENWDGSGYPDGLAGEAIPLLARIVALVDTWDAMTHDRPYRRAHTPEIVLEHILAHAGSRFDPVLAPQFVEMMRVLMAQHPDLDAFLGEEAQHSSFIQARRRLSQVLATGHSGSLGH